jgi:hypothetical protein
VSEVNDPQVAKIRDAVRVAQGVQGIEGRELLTDPETTPVAAVSGLRERLLTRRQRASLRHRHRAARRAEKAVDFDAALDDRGHRELRKRQLATSPARKAANLARIQTAVITVAVPVIIALGAASTTAVHAFMTKYAAASAAVSWAMEPAVITLVSGVIVVRALMLRNGAVLPPLVTWIERGALATSVVMCLLGAGWGAIVAPLGVALVAITVERIIAGIADADVGDLPHPSPERKGYTPVRTPERPPGPRWEPLADGRRLLMGGVPFDGWLSPGGRPLLPIVARADSDADRAHDESAGPDPDAWVFDQGQSLAEQIEAFLGEDPPGQPARTNGVGPDTPGGPESAHKPLPRSGQPEGDTTPEQVSSSVSEGDGGEANELVIPANQARRLRSLETLYRVAEYRAARPDSSADDVAEHIGASVSTARKYLRQLKQIQGGEE